MGDDDKISKCFSDVVTAEQINWQAKLLTDEIKDLDITEDRKRTINARITGVLYNITQGNCNSNMLSIAQIALDSITDEIQTQLSATNDHLTGLLNRLGIENLSKARFAEARRNGKEIGVFFIDLDKFKPINDELGHKNGDKALKLCAAEITNNVRQEDIVSRIGGDEFVIMMLNDKGHDWKTEYNKLSNLFHNLTYTSDEGDKYPIGASIGFVISEDGMLPEEAIALADIEMYKVKNRAPDANGDLYPDLDYNFLKEESPQPE